MKANLVSLAILVAAVGVQADEWADKRDAARQRGADRGFKTESAAREKIEPNGRLDVPPFSKPALNPPDGRAYARVMEAERALKDSTQTNVSDTVREGNQEAYDHSREEALSLYPQLSVSGSAFSLRCAEILEWMRLKQLPIIRDDRLPLVVAHIVAIEQTGGMQRDSQGIAKPRAPKRQAPSGEEVMKIAESMGADSKIPGAQPLAIPSEISFRVNGDRVRFEDGRSGRIRTDLSGRRMVDIGAATESGMRREIELPKGLTSGTRQIMRPDGMMGTLHRFGDRYTLSP